jgi:hypothetical protein
MTREKRFPCPGCGFLVFVEPSSYEICPVCFWDDNPVQLTESLTGWFANHVSLLEGQKHFRALGYCEERLKQFVRPPFAR